MQRLLKLKKYLRNPNLSLFSENSRIQKNMEDKYRPLTPSEIEVLEKNVNRCEDWSRIRVETNFSPL